MKLEDIGFYTLSDKRAMEAGIASPVMRCEVLVTGRCNFRCKYCRSMGEELDGGQVAVTLLRTKAKNVRFSGGEPTLAKELGIYVGMAKGCGAKRVAISTNGSADWGVYEELIERGVNDFSVSLDACCAGDVEKIAGVGGVGKKVIENIRKLSERIYTTVGVVIVEDNVEQVERTILLADSLGVWDIRVIPAAQYSLALERMELPEKVWRKYPILRYRIERQVNGFPVRGIREWDSDRCGLVVDDLAVMGNRHYPCIIYLREGGEAIGKIEKGWREKRVKWAEEHDTKEDPICRKNCLDVCVEYNNVYTKAHGK